MMHMVNHMGQYPLGAGPSRVDSLISEHEDNANVDADELLPSIFNAPNVQVSVLVKLVTHSTHGIFSSHAFTNVGVKVQARSILRLLWCRLSIFQSLEGLRQADFPTFMISSVMVILEERIKRIFL